MNFGTASRRTERSCCYGSAQDKKASSTASRSRVPPAPRNCLFSTLQDSQFAPVSGSPRSTGEYDRPSKGVPVRSTLTNQPGLSSVSTWTPNECSHSPLHCSSYHSVRRASWFMLRGLTFDVRGGPLA